MTSGESVQHFATLQANLIEIIRCRYDRGPLWSAAWPTRMCWTTPRQDARDGHSRGRPWGRVRLLKAAELTLREILLVNSRHAAVGSESLIAPPAEVPVTSFDVRMTGITEATLATAAGPEQVMADLDRRLAAAP
ncbi:hypothetical protein [Nonomuraea sp. 10N515B]|uniref:hypothetical protein n=1 Tax=Nonomuraea sp. 10N515B TaxID=3457422 RepID=UPI003FCD54B4